MSVITRPLVRRRSASATICCASRASARPFDADAGRSIIGASPIGQVASYIGIAPSAYDSGDGRRSQGISKAGNRLARVAMVEAAWLWLRHQPDSALSKWFHDRTQGRCQNKLA